MTTQANCIMGLYAQTSIHAGTGQNTGAIDLPIQREGHNGYPCIYGSAMKGAMRSHAETQYGKADDKVTLSFGPEMSASGGSDHAGALMISDARILLLPIRSLTSQFKWVTCPNVLQRYKQDAIRFGITVDFDIPEIPNTNTDEALALISNKAENPEDSLFLEEYRFKAQTHDLDTIIAALTQLMATQGNTEQNLQQQLTIISNDMFSHISEHATPVNAHIAIDSSTKIVKPGALWYEETLPPETLLYIGISSNASRKDKDDTTATSILSNLTNLFVAEGASPFLQVGGNETVGMGWCAIKTIKA
ncbi:MAG: type III-B CRISPR module RAMP protein Cmr4 [Ghiorsea sp.]|nr:type III-B CRISPR module RAMP protein Cmr4 [Ghiorsea sp.]